MTTALSPPPYGEVFDRYGIDILRAPGDLVIKDGDLALTKSGDLMLKNTEFSAMRRLVQGWRYNFPTLVTLFERVFSLKTEHKQLEMEIDGVFANRVFDPNATIPLAPSETSIARYHELNDEIAANEIGSSAYAGAVVLVLSRLLLSFKDDLAATADEWEKSHPLIEGVSLGMVLAASANNFRHNDEWAKTQPPTRQQLASILVLAAAFRQPLPLDGSPHRFSRDICPETLELLSGGDFERLSCSFFAFANNIVNRRGC